MRVQGPALETTTQDYLWTTPERLLLVCTSVLDTFEGYKGDESKLGCVASLMNPDVIEKIGVIKLEIEKHFM